MNKPRQFINTIVEENEIIKDLRQTLTTKYQRTTIVDPNTQTRMTCDELLTCTDWENNTISLPMIILLDKILTTSKSLRYMVMGPSLPPK